MKKGKRKICKDAAAMDGPMVFLARLTRPHKATMLNKPSNDEDHELFVFLPTVLTLDKEMFFRLRALVKMAALKYTLIEIHGRHKTHRRRISCFFPSG
jgi:hypothetical protein